MSVFSTKRQNFIFVLANPINSSEYDTAAAFESALLVLIPNASANLAFRFAIAHSFVHFNG